STQSTWSRLASSPSRIDGMAMFTMVRSSRVMNRPRPSTPSAAIGWLRMRFIGGSPSSRELLEGEADEVDRRGDEDEEQAEPNWGIPAAPALRQAPWRSVLRFDFGHAIRS